LGQLGGRTRRDLLLQGLEVAHVLVERGRGDPGAAGNGGKGQGSPSLLVDQGDRRVDHGLGRKAGPRHG
jgi:hypothetical protein